MRSAAGADLIVLPELWAVGYFSFDSYAENSESLSGSSVSDATLWAQELGAYVHLGSFIEAVSPGLYRNTAVLIDPLGQIVQKYSKIHVFGYESQEAQLLEPGDYISVEDTPYGHISSTTCYDLRFPELWRSLVDAKAEIVVVPAAWPLARLEHWKLFTCTRAVENQVIVIACNAVGIQSSTELGGHSRVIDPWGTVLVEAGRAEGVTFCDIDPQVVELTRREFPVLGDRLSTYGNLQLRNSEDLGL